jgi:hypothetical protein
MELCILAQLVIFLSVVTTFFDVFLIETTTEGILTNILISVIVTALLAAATNWSCYYQTYSWIAWIILILTVVPVLVMPYMILNRNDPEIKKEIAEERKLRKPKEKFEGRNGARGY